MKVPDQLPEDARHNHLPPQHPAYIHVKDSYTAAQCPAPETRSLQFTYKLKFCTSINFSSTLFLSLGEDRYIVRAKEIHHDPTTPCLFLNLTAVSCASLKVGGGSRAGSDSQKGGRRSSLRAGHESVSPRLNQDTFKSG